MSPRRVLFVCSDNAIRSQMAEAWLRHLGGAQFIARSAGIEPRHLNPIATQVMQEVDVFIGAQRGKGLDAIKLERFDVVVTLCDEASDAVAHLPAEWTREHHEFDDPSFLEDPEGPDVDAYRAVRDELRALVAGMVGEEA